MQWNLISNAPENEEIMVFYGDDWCPKCIVRDGVLYEYILVTRNWDSYMEWDWLSKNLNDPNIFWAPTPKRSDFPPSQS